MSLDAMVRGKKVSHELAAVGASLEGINYCDGVAAHKKMRNADIQNKRRDSSPEAWHCAVRQEWREAEAFKCNARLILRYKRFYFRLFNMPLNSSLDVKSLFPEHLSV